jgi:putative transposase
MDAVLHEDVFWATSEGEKLPSLKPLRKNQAKLTRISTKRNKRKRGSKARRKLAKLSRVVVVDLKLKEIQA